jgi:transposase-like protein
MPKAQSTASAPRLTAQRKLELYQATRAPEAPIGELLRQAGVHLNDLREIEQTIESAALAALKVKGRHGRLPTEVTPERMLQLERELQEKTTALAELSVAYTLLEKKERVVLPNSPPAHRSRRRRSK